MIKTSHLALFSLVLAGNAVANPERGLKDKAVGLWKKESVVSVGEFERSVRWSYIAIGSSIGVPLVLISAKTFRGMCGRTSGVDYLDILAAPLEGMAATITGLVGCNALGIAYATGVKKVPTQSDTSK